MTVNITNITGDRVEFVQDGRPNSWTGLTARAGSGDLRATAASMIERANDLQRRAQVMRAVADFKDAESLVHANAAAKQRRERAAATRAHNADPFGFKAAGH